MSPAPTLSIEAIGRVDPYLQQIAPAQLYGDMPALVYGPRAELSHGFDERVSLESLRQVTKTMTLFLAEWCGVERI
jgi:acetylornithine deacetylase/succinyl-diaminopimelate desuccinylase-like protein